MNMEQELIWMKDCYVKEWDATVLNVKDGKFVVLDKVNFYPKGGGLAWDTGKIMKGNEEFNVVYSGKFEGMVSLEVDKPGLEPGDEVHCILDWDRRYKLMRLHTAVHVLAAVVNKASNALITGNYLDVSKSRMDFSLENFDRDKFMEYVEETNRVLAEGHEVKIYFLPREEALKIPGIVKLASKMPPNVGELRIVEIEGVDIQADGGPHVRNTKECGKIKVLKFENKGKGRKRVYFDLE